MESRSETKFSVGPRFKKVVKDFGPSDAAIVMSDIQLFEQAWKKSTRDDEIPTRYDFKAYKGINRPYKLCQIRVGPNRRSRVYRAAIIFYDELAGACWIHAFKKQGDSEPQEVQRAIAWADDYWNALKERGTWNKTETTE